MINYLIIAVLHCSKFERVIILIAFNYSLINWINFSIIKRICGGIKGRDKFILQNYFTKWQILISVSFSVGISANPRTDNVDYTAQYFRHAN